MSEPADYRWIRLRDELQAKERQADQRYEDAVQVYVAAREAYLAHLRTAPIYITTNLDTVKTY